MPETLRLEYEPLILQLANPFGTARGTKTEAHNVLVRLSYEGVQGLGEAAPHTVFNETPNSVQDFLRDVIDEGLLMGDPLNFENILDCVEEHLPKHYAAKAALDIAFHDLVGKIKMQPVHGLLGLPSEPSPPIDLTIGIDRIDVMLRKTEEALGLGHQSLKIKLGTNYDREIISKISQLTKDLPLQVDANCAWSLEQAIENVAWLSDFNLALIEQPLAKSALPEEFQRLKERTDIPIFVDESVCHLSELEIFAPHVDGVVIKLMKTGGIRKSLQLIQSAKQKGLKVMLGCMIESSIAITAASHLAWLADFSDLDGSLLLKNDPYVGAYYDSGFLKLPAGNGLGVSINSA